MLQKTEKMFILDASIFKQINGAQRNFITIQKANRMSSILQDTEPSTATHVEHSI